MATTDLEMAPDEQQNLKKILSCDDAPEARVTLPERVKSLLMWWATRRRGDAALMRSSAELTWVG
jgi:hypothetical protein